MMDVMTSPSATMKLKTRDCAHRMKQGSPKLQEVLRERCRRRMKEKRSELFQRRRLDMDRAPETIQNTLKEMMHDEVRSLIESDINREFDLDDELELERAFLAEQEQWVVQEYETIMNTEDEFLAALDNSHLQESVTCPMCQKALLKENSECIYCTACEFRLPAQIGLKNLLISITEKVEIHSLTCRNMPCFTIIPDNDDNNLYLTCYSCSTLTHVI